MDDIDEPTATMAPHRTVFVVFAMSWNGSVACCVLHAERKGTALTMAVRIGKYRASPISQPTTETQEHTESNIIIIITIIMIMKNTEQHDFFFSLTQRSQVSKTMSTNIQTDVQNTDISTLPTGTE